MPKNAPRASSCLGPFARSGLSLAQNDPRFHGYRPKVIAPGLLLRFLASRFHRPFDRKLHYRAFSSARPLHRSLPVAASTTGFPAALPTLAPLRDFYSLRIKASRNLPPFGPPSDPPDFRSLPVASSIARFGPGSSFPIRYFSEACCSSNLLEPHSECPKTKSASKGFCRGTPVFLSFFSYSFERVTMVLRWNACGKNMRQITCLYPGSETCRCSWPARAGRHPSGQPGRPGSPERDNPPPSRSNS